MSDDNQFQIVQYAKPPVWAEYLAYLAGIALMSAAIVTGNIYYTVALAGMVLYWNYTLFSTLRAYVRYVNASEFNKLLEHMNELENNKQKDGTIPVQESLTKEQGDEEDPSR